MKKLLRKLAVSFAIGFTAIGGVWAGLETGTYISDLVATNPTAGDPVAQGDDHVRLLKSTIKASFPNISGAMTLTHSQLNLLNDKTLAATGYQKHASGFIMQWANATTNASGVATVSYPLAYGTTHISSYCSQGSGNYTMSLSFGASSTTANVMTASTGAAAAAGITVYCVSIGY